MAKQRNLWSRLSVWLVLGTFFLINEMGYGRNLRLHSGRKKKNKDSSGHKSSGANIIAEIRRSRQTTRDSLQKESEDEDSFFIEGSEVARNEKTNDHNSITISLGEEIRGHQVGAQELPWYYVPAKAATKKRSSQRQIRVPWHDSPQVPMCNVTGVIERREMGSLGVSSFQQVWALLVADMLGEGWSYYDDWPDMARLLRKDKQTTKAKAQEFKSKCRLIRITPTSQNANDVVPFTFQPSQIIGNIRRMVCGLDAMNRVKAPSERSGYGKDKDPDCVHLTITNHWQHISYFQPYRDFIATNILRGVSDMAESYLHGTSASDAAKAGIVVYLRLGDKATAGDTLLTFQAKFYDTVLEKRRAYADSCTIVTHSKKDPRALALATRHDCIIVSSNDPYIDWSIMFSASKILIMAASTFVYFQALIGSATEIHFPAVGFFHSRHNVCFNQYKKKDTHFSQIRLPADDPRFVYHDMYSRQFFLNYEDFLDQAAAISCDTIMKQHICPPEIKFKAFITKESRYCYGIANETSSEQAQVARDRANEMSTMRLQKKYKN